MGRLLFFALTAVLIFWLITRWGRIETDQNDESSSAKGEDMVCCDYCGLHLPRSESIIIKNKIFCSEEHHHLYSE